MSHPIGPQDRESIIESHLRAVQERERASFHMPGHKGGLGAPERGRALLGDAVYELDLSELSGFDYLHAANSALIDAQNRAARVFGAEKSWFLINGATVGNIVAIGATVGDNEEILVARDSHRSVYAGIAIAGARPIYLAPKQNTALDGLYGIDVAALQAALHAHPNIRAIHVTSPSYYGFTIPIQQIADLAHDRGLPLIVDEAHGAHFVFHEDFPRSALSCGADLVVQSPHKTLGSLTQSSLLHAQHERVDLTKVHSLLGMHQSSSPSALLLLSLDLAIAEMSARGHERWNSTLQIARQIRAAVNDVNGIRAYGAEIRHTPGIDSFDPIKIVIDVHELGTTGFAASRWLRDRHQINPEFADLRRMVFSVTTGDSDATAELLIEAVGALGANGQLSTEYPSLVSLWPPALPMEQLSPREAQRMRSESVPSSAAIGKVSAEMIVPYPPGVPLLVPGERISEDVVGSMNQLIGAGCRVVGLSDPTGDTLRIVTVD